MDNPETQTTQQRVTKKEAIKNGQSQRPRQHRRKTN